MANISVKNLIDAFSIAAALFTSMLFRYVKIKLD